MWCAAEDARRIVNLQVSNSAGVLRVTKLACRKDSLVRTLHMFFLRLTSTIVVFLAFAALPARAQQAIFTTNADGSCVNCNHYETKADV